ncbi:MAG: EF-hand domain-containing protein [Phycisphaerales bacterium]
MTTRTLLTSSISSTIAIVLLAAPARAQLAIASFTIDGGGGTSAGGAFTLMGTIGQHDAGAMSAGAVAIAGGFWIGSRRPACPTDFNGDGFVEPGDLDEFITSYFSTDPAEVARCDFNADGFVEPGDLDEFITAFFEGC